MRNKILLGLVLAIFLINIVSAQEIATTTCNSILSCYHDGVSYEPNVYNASTHQCACEQINNIDTLFLSALLIDEDTGLKTRSSSLAEGVINLSTTFPYQEVSISNATLNIYHYIAGTLATCELQYSVNNGATWNTLRNCVGDSTPQNYPFDLTTLTQSELENLLINVSAVRTGGASFAWTRLNYINISVEYSEVQQFQGGGGGDELFSIMESSGAGLGTFMESVSVALPTFIIPLFFVVLILLVGLSIAKVIREMKPK